MKVFCNGAQMSCGRESIITHKINEYISTQSEIMVSDYNIGDYETQKYLSDKEYKNVTIGSCPQLSRPTQLFQECTKKSAA